MNSLRTTTILYLARLVALAAVVLATWSGVSGRTFAAGDAPAGASSSSSLSSAGTLAANPNRKDPMANFKKPDEPELRTKLTPLQFKVTQEEGTEPPFRNEFWDNHEEGIYVDVVSDEPLFSSKDKYDSGTGWPSFSKPLEPANVTEKSDNSLFSSRTEVRSKHGDSHLGHVFPDGPRPTGTRYCMNSASLRFVSVDKLEAEGYAQYLPLFGRAASVAAGATSAAQGGAAASAAAESAATATKKTAAYEGDVEIALLAGGCFWGVEDLIRKLPGVVDTDVGYTGGDVANATYQNHGNHAEAVRIKFDPAKISYDDVLRYFFRLHDPTTMNRQGNDRGASYRSAIFTLDDRQKEIAGRVKTEVDKSGKWTSPVVTEITAAGPFWLAEDYHQDYLKKDPNGYTCHFLRD